MRIAFSYSEPFTNGRRVVTFNWSPDKKSEKELKDFMSKFSGEGLTILPIKIEATYLDGSKETTSAFLSSLCEKNNRIINNSSNSNPVIMDCVQSTGIIYNEKKSFKERIKKWFGYK
jgi:hypothetical protein